MLKLFKTQKGGSAMVKRGKLLASLALSALSVVAFYGCGGGSGSNVSSNPTDGTVLLAKTGTLVVSAKFPTGNEPGQIGTALIDENTAKIVVVVFNESGYSEDVILTRDNPTARIANVPIGRVSVYITTYDSADNLLDYLNVDGEIVEGENTLVATLIRGYWKFVDENGNPVSIRLNKTLDTDTTTLTGFSVIPFMSLSGPGPTDYVSIQGCVYDDPTTPDPIPGATVSTSLDSVTAVTGSDGCFFLQTNTPANYCCTPYTITITAPGYPTFSQSLVWGDHPTNQKFYLNTGSVASASMKKSSIDWNKHFGWSEYNLLWKGSGFSPELCDDSTETCWDEGLSYFNQFIGPSTNNNAIDSKHLPLPKAGDYPRSAFIVGTGPEGMSNISDPDALNYFNSKVTGPNTMEGHIVELLTKSETFTCYDLSGNEIECPEIDSASKSNKGLSKAIVKAISQRAGKSAIDSDGCFRDLNISSTYEEEADSYKVVVTWDWAGDACVHSFKAEGSQLPSTDLDLTIQRKK